MIWRSIKWDLFWYPKITLAKEEENEETRERENKKPENQVPSLLQVGWGRAFYFFIISLLNIRLKILNSICISLIPMYNLEKIIKILTFNTNDW